MTTICRETTVFSISSGAEMAMCGWWWFDAADATAAELASMFAGVTADDAYWWDNTGDAARNQFSTTVAVADRYLSLLDEGTGHFDVRIPLEMPGNAAGAQVNAQLPAEVAPCVSVRSGLSDKKTNGRFYLPPPTTITIIGTGSFTTDFMSEVLNSLQTYFLAVQDAVGTDLTLGTYSRTGSAFASATSINIGNIPDSQRRRRNKLVEIRETAAL